MDDTSVVIDGQEAIHIIKVLRHKTGDSIHIANGRGSIFECAIDQISGNKVYTRVLDKIEGEKPKYRKIICIGIIKVRDRFEFAIEKAVELGATEIVVFNADNTQRAKVNKERLRLLILSAFKQSGRFWLPELRVLDSLDEVYTQFNGYKYIMAHEKTSIHHKPENVETDIVLMVGPEGGFSSRELKLHEDRGGYFVSLGKNRLRAETAVAALLSQYLFLG